MANDVIRSGSIHVFGGDGPGPTIAAFSGAAAHSLGNRTVPVRVIEAATLRTIGEGTLAAAQIEGDELVGSIRWSADLDDRVSAGDATARCRFADDGSIVKVVVELDEDGGGVDEDDGDIAEFAALPNHSPYARFSTIIPTTHRRTEGGYNIYPDAILFEVGDYSDKSFSMSESEAALAVSRFAAPVGGNIEHTNFMRGRACQVRSLRIDPDDPRIIRGEVALPSTFDDHLIDEERRVSCEWDRITKELTGLALTVNPRVKKAALVAAFVANEATADDVAAFAAEDDADPEIVAAFATPRKHDPDLSRQMQGLHDNIARNHPWTCGGGKVAQQGAATFGKSEDSPYGYCPRCGAKGQTRERRPNGNDTCENGHTYPARDSLKQPPTAAFGDKPKQFKAIQALHNQTKEHGATCPGDSRPLFSGRSPMSTAATATKKRGFLARLLGLADEHTATFNEVVSEETAEKWLTELTANGAVATGDDAVNEVAQKVAEVVAAPAAFSLADAPEFKALQAELAAERQKNADNAADLERRRVADIATASANFAQSVLDADKATSGEYDDIAADYAEAAEADHATGGTVTFSAADGTQATGTRVAKLEARYARRPSLKLLGHATTGEDLPKGARIAAFGQGKKDIDPEVERRELLNKTPAGRAVLEREDAAKTK